MTGKPIKFAGIGEKLEEFEPFHPERMASRILGMGDVVSLVEKAAEAVDLDDAKRMEEKMRKGQFTLEDFLDQLRQMKKLGPLEIYRRHAARRRGSAEEADLNKQEKEFRHMEAMICGMTPQERRNPAHPQCAAPPAHRQRQRRLRDGIEHDAEQICARCSR